MSQRKVLGVLCDELSSRSPWCGGRCWQPLGRRFWRDSDALFFSSHQCQLKEPSQPLPLPSEGSMEDEELPAQRYERDLVQKLKVLRHELSLQQPQAGHCRIEVSREEIFEVRDGVQPTVRHRLHSCSTKQGDAA